MSSLLTKCCLIQTVQAFPVIFMALFERDVDDIVMLQHSELYIFSQKGFAFSSTNFTT